MFCSKCGTNNEEASAFCKQCGNVLQAVGQTPSYQPPPTYNAPPPTFNPPPPPYNPQQSGYAQMGQQPVQVPNYMVQSVLVTLLCCLPLGIVGIIKASNVNSRLAMGDVQGAIQASNEAKNMVTIGVIAGLVVSVLWVIVVIAAAS